MNCEEFQAEYLSGANGAAATAHLTTCPVCRSEITHLDRIRRDLADPMLWEKPSADLGDRVVESVMAVARPPAHPVAGSRRVRLVSVAAAAVVTVASLGIWQVVSTRPDWTLELIATAQAPDAAAAVEGWNAETGTRMEIRVDGLPPTGANAYYEVWMTAADGRHVSAGSFRSSGTITVWSGVRRSEFPRIWITLEPNDADPTPSRDVVFDVEA